MQAVELMEQPRRRHGDVSLETEYKFTRMLRDAVAEAGARGLDAHLVQQLAGAWRRLQRSGVLQARRVEESIMLDMPHTRAFEAAIQSSLTAPGLRRCALDGCGAKEAHPGHFRCCAACRMVVYCCREHQVGGGGLARAQKGVQSGAQGGCCRGGGGRGGTQRRVMLS